MKEAEHIADVRKWGNGGGVLLPREWLGMQVKFVLIDRTLELRKEVLAILEPYMEEIMGIYLVGSYARGDQREDSDIDILVISHQMKKMIRSGKYEIEIMPLKQVLALMKQYPAMIYPKIVDARPLMNKGLLEELRDIPLAPDAMRRYLHDCTRIIREDRALLAKDARSGEVLRSTSIVYSALLRLRALYMMQQIEKRERYSTEAFESQVIASLGIGRAEWSDLHEVYKAVRDDRRTRVRVPLATAARLIDVLERAVKTYGKTKKTA